MFRSKATTYAVLAVVELAKQTKLEPSKRPGIQAGQLAEAYKLPAAYAAKVLSQLARARVLRSGRGPKGGFRLSRPPGEITLLEVVDAVKGLADTQAKKLHRPIPSAVREGLSVVFEEVTGRVREALKGVTMADFLASNLSQTIGGHLKAGG